MPTINKSTKRPWNKGDRDFYHSKEWRKLRKAKIKSQRKIDAQYATDLLMDNRITVIQASNFSTMQTWDGLPMPLCEQCKSEGKLTPGPICDHIKPISQGGEKLPPLEGLQMLCEYHHNLKRGTE